MFNSKQLERLKAKMRFSKSLLIILFFPFYFLSGCESGGSQDKDLKEYVANVLARPSQPIPNIVPLTPQPGFTYNRQNVRSPFKPYSANLKDLPDLKRTKEELEFFPMDGLKMVGKLSKNNMDWAIIRAPDETIHFISVGGHLGENFGKVVAIRPEGIDILEYVPTSEGIWEEHKTTMDMDQTS